jgi:hypothetical protein
MSKQDDDDFMLAEEIERRGDPRGIFPGLEIELHGSKATRYAAVEGGRKGFFVAEADPDRFRLGELVEAKVSLGGRTASCQVEIYRKESQPRRGMALKVVSADPANDELLRLMFLQPPPAP